MTRRPLTPDEAAVWTAVTTSVRRRGRPVATQAPAPDDLAAQWRRLFETTATDPAARGPSLQIAPAVRPSSLAPPPHSVARGGADLHRPALRTPVERSHERKIRRGRVEIDGVLDLHGLTLDRAQAAVERFVLAAHARGADCIVVITGKGRRPGRATDDFAPRDGVLRRAFPDWIAAPSVRSAVAGFARAHDRHGGDGAWYVFLRRPSHHA